MSVVHWSTPEKLALPALTVMTPAVTLHIPLAVTLRAPDAWIVIAASHLMLMTADDWTVIAASVLTFMTPVDSTLIIPVDLIEVWPCVSMLVCAVDLTLRLPAVTLMAMPSGPTVIVFWLASTTALPG